MKLSKKKIGKKEEDFLLAMVLKYLRSQTEAGEAVGVISG